MRVNLERPSRSNRIGPEIGGWQGVAIERMIQNMRRNLVRLLLATLTLGGATVVLSAQEEEPLDVETILLETPTAEDYGDIDSCLYRRKYDHVEMLDDRHMLFEGRNRVWLNRLRGSCGIRDDAILVIEQYSTSTCRSDRVTGHSRGSPSMIHGSCILGDFQEIDPQQAIVLKESIKLAKQTRRQQAKQRKREAKRQREDAS